MTRPIAIACALAAAVFAGCGDGQDIEVPDGNETAQRGAELFYERCSGCHTLTRANSFGSKEAGQLDAGERTNGPNFDIRQVSEEDALFAIRNGGFSGAIMPANIVVGEDADAVAQFLAEYAGEGGGGADDVTSSGQTE